MNTWDSEVTAIITTHNRASLVKKAIESVFQQTLIPFEVIVVDDASTDNTKTVIGEMLSRYPFKYIRIEPENSRGGNFARNTGILSSSGTFIAFLDDDDSWVPTKIEKQKLFLDTNPNISVVSCGVMYLNNGKITPSNPTLLSEGDLSKKIFASSPYVSSTLMIRRAALMETGFFDENLKFWQDYELMIRLAQISKIGVIHENLTILNVSINDSNRLTNKLTGFEETINYIEAKHHSIFIQLPSEYIDKWQINCLNELIRRAQGQSARKKRRHYLFLKEKRQPSLINLIKLAFNIGSFH